MHRSSFLLPNLLVLFYQSLWLKTNPHSALFLHASPRVCSHWQRQWLWFAVFLTPEYGYLEYMVSRHLSGEALREECKKVRQWKKQDVNTGPGAHLQTCTQTVKLFLHPAWQLSLSWELITATSQVCQYKKVNTEDAFTALHFLILSSSVWHLEDALLKTIRAT